MLNRVEAEGIREPQVGKSTRVLVVDDHMVVRRGIQMLLSTDSSIQVVGEAKDGWDAVRQADRLRPDVILMDLVMPHSDGIQAIAEIKRRIPNVKIIVLTTFGDEAKVKAAMEARADGYLLKDADGDALLNAIHAAQQDQMPVHPQITQQLVKNLGKRADASGVRSLTERERDVIRLMSQGLSNKAIAHALGLSEGTVKVHVSNILSKLSASSRTEASIKALQDGLVSPDRNG